MSVLPGNTRHGGARQGHGSSVHGLEIPSVFSAVSEVRLQPRLREHLAPRQSFPKWGSHRQTAGSVFP